MSEERFDRIEHRLDRLEVGQNELKAQLTAQGRRLDGHDGRFDALDRRVESLETRVTDLARHMHVLHEDVIARIAAIPEYTGPTKAEMNHGFADLREMIGRRLDPLEATVRQHSIDIERLKQDRA
jgi:archaellum component FlaC